MNGNDANTKLDALRQREAALRAKIAEEVKRQQKQQWRNFDRLRAIVGGALIRISEANPDFKTMLVQSLQTADLSAGEREFLKSQGRQ